MARVLCIGVVTQWAEYLRQASRMASAKTPSGGVAQRIGGASQRSLNGLEQVTPSAAKGAPEIDEDAEGGSDAARFQFLVMPAAEVHFFGHLLLSQTGGFAQSSEIATKGKKMGLCKRFQTETVPESGCGKHVTAWRVRLCGHAQCLNSRCSKANRALHASLSDPTKREPERPAEGGKTGGSRERKATRRRNAQSRIKMGGWDDLTIPESAKGAAVDPSRGGGSLGAISNSTRASAQ